MRGVIVIIAIAAAGVIAYAILPLGGNDHTEVSAAIIPDGALAAVSLPENLSQNAQIGKPSFWCKMRFVPWDQCCRSGRYSATFGPHHL